MNTYKIKINSKTYAVVTENKQDFVFGALIGMDMLHDGDTFEIESILTDVPIVVVPVENLTFKTRSF